MLWLLWGLEAVIIVGGSTLLATAEIASGVFCEDCNQWCDQIPDASRFDLPEEQDTLQELRPDNLKPIAGLNPADPSATVYLQFDMWKCSKCNSTGALQVKLCEVVPDENGAPKENTSDLTEIWTVSPGNLDAIREFESAVP